MVRTRFAPSPTGYLHVGGLRTALFSYLFAQANNGTFVLRLEDTDRNRFVEGSVENILSSLYWAGIVPDEGLILKDGTPTQAGEFGPYIQSERLKIYQDYCQELLDRGEAYYCFCTSERLTNLRKTQEENKLPTGYDGNCMKLPKAEVMKNLAGGVKHSVRLKMPKDGETRFTDLIKGEVVFKNSLIDDQILLKSDGFPTYHLAVVVDDHLMQITHVIRGDEWVSSTPKHLQLYKYFGWQPPVFAHLPLLLNTDKSKLSKRQGDVAVEDYRKKGYLPEALVNFAAFLGWNPGTDEEMFTLSKLVQSFNLSKVNKSGAVFNLEKLDWFNREYLKTLSGPELVERVKPFLKSIRTKSADQTFLVNALLLERGRVTTLRELPEAIDFVFDVKAYDQALLLGKKGTAEEVKKVLGMLHTKLSELKTGFTKEELEQELLPWIKAEGLTNGTVLWPLRVALTGQENSPGPFEVAAVLGREETLKRIEKAQGLV